MGGALSIASDAGLGHLWAVLTSYWKFMLQPSTMKEPTTESSDFFVARRGDLLLQRYRIQAKLGGGVYSTTYLITDEQNRFAPYIGPLTMMLTRIRTVRSRRTKR